MQVFLLDIDGRTTVCDSFRNAMRHAAQTLFPGADLRDQLRSQATEGCLAELGVGGSVHQWLRYRASATGCTVFRIDEHEAGGPPGHPSLVRSLDLLSETEPSYELQAAVWDLASGSRGPEVLAPRLRLNISRDIAAKRAIGVEDGDILEGYRLLEIRMGGVKVIPQVGRSGNILDGLPDRAAEIFRVAAAEVEPVGTAEPS